jgi:hypothetical protein
MKIISKVSGYLQDSSASGKEVTVVQSNIKNKAENAKRTFKGKRQDCDILKSDLIPNELVNEWFDVNLLLRIGPPHSEMLWKQFAEVIYLYAYFISLLI